MKVYVLNGTKMKDDRGHMDYDTSGKSNLISITNSITRSPSGPVSPGGPGAPIGPCK